MEEYKRMSSAIEIGNIKAGLRADKYTKIKEKKTGRGGGMRPGGD
jgi:hypothetical protein